jgi:predicted DNA-binding transcriptional regulator AlpA
MRTPAAESLLPFVPLLLRREWAAAYVGMSPSTFDGEVRAGRLPKPIPTTNTLKAWHRHDLEAWAQDRRAERQAAGDGSHNPWDDA